jgi:hypothetical protein
MPSDQQSGQQLETIRQAGSTHADVSRRPFRPLSPILVHVCLTDGSPSEWAGLNGSAERDGAPVLRLALDALADHYGLDRRERRAA